MAGRNDCIYKRRASSLPSDIDRAMREASSSRTVTDTDTDSYAFLVYINQSNANEGMTEAKNCNNEKWPMPKKIRLYSFYFNRLCFTYEVTING